MALFFPQLPPADSTLEKPCIRRIDWECKETTSTTITGRSQLVRPSVSECTSGKSKGKILEYVSWPYWGEYSSSRSSGTGQTDIPSPKAKWSDLEQNLEKLGALSDDWDGYGAPRPNRKAATIAKQALMKLFDLNMPPKTITPTVEGGIGMTFRSGKRVASVEFLNDGEVLGLLDIDDVPEPPQIFEGKSGELESILTRVRKFIEHWEGEIDSESSAD